MYAVSVMTAAFLITASAHSAEKKKFALYAAKFKNGGYIPAEYAMTRIRGGKNISPAMFWKNAPENTKYFALICIDLNPVAHRWVHWMVVNIPVKADKLQEGASMKKMPAGSEELLNSFGFQGWGGPQPPPGTGVHKYLFVLLALKDKVIPGNITDEKSFLKSVQGKVTGKAAISGLFIFR